MNKKTIFVDCCRCVMNNEADPSITFNDEGLCNHCVRYDNLAESRLVSVEDREKKLEALTNKIKKSGRGKEYDCIVGVSGGVDSTYVAYLTRKLGLRPLAVHFDNGWNSELAVKNIEKVLKKLDVDLYTYVIDWEEFRSLQLAFLKASTPDGEIPTDHAIFALLWREASKRKIKYIISGMNFSTESIRVPSWSYGHSDWTYIKDINRRFGQRKLRNYPHFSLSYLFYVSLIRNVRTVSILNYIDYKKDEVMKILSQDLGWVYYGGKHFESIYTRFFQGYLLPKKFGINKRYGHLSDLINAGQISKTEAIKLLAQSDYSEIQQKEDVEYVKKKLGLSDSEFNDILKAPVRYFSDYKNQFKKVELLKNVVNKFRLIGLYPK